NRLLFSSGIIANHKSVSRVYRMYFPSLDQSFAKLLTPPCMIGFSSCLPSEFFIYRSLLDCGLEVDCRLEAKTNCAPFGLHTGTWSAAGSKVSRLALPRCRSSVQTSVFWLVISVMLTATNFLFGAMDMLPYTSGLPTTPISFPLRSNQVGWDRATPLPVCATSVPASETSKIPLLTCR